MHPADAMGGKRFYARDRWSERLWIEAISVEYKSLLDQYPFETTMKGLAEEGTLDLLDVGCGSAIFPRYLEPHLESDLVIFTDLLDISGPSLDRSRRIMERLNHFQPSHSYQIEIESIPDVLSPDRSRYQMIWAIHSLTTVDRASMPTVLNHLYKLLTPGGRLLIYQLAAPSSYQRLHAFYRSHQPQGVSIERYMQAEDTLQMLQSLQLTPRSNPLRFEHQVPDDDLEALENYLRKIVLDESLQASSFFEPVLGDYLDEKRGQYRFQQEVHLIEVVRE